MRPRPLDDATLAKLLGVLAGKNEFVFLETTRPSAEESRSLLFLDPSERLLFRAGEDPVLFLHAMEKRLGTGMHLAGWFAFEFGYLLEPVLARNFSIEPGTVLADLGVFAPPLVHDHRLGSFLGAEPAGWRDSVPFPAGVSSVHNVRLNQQQEAYAVHIQRIREWIARGDTYQVNYTLKLLFEATGGAEALYAALRRNQSVAYAAFLRSRGEDVLSFSPELFFRKQGRHVEVRPMKGTAARGRTPEEDGERARALAADEKNRAENVMIVDLLRNDLGRLCEPGGVRVERLFDVERYETLLQMTSTISGTLRGTVGLFDLMAALFPSGSVTGAPKIRTMEIIRELETTNRGVYTGGIGYFAPEGEVVMNVPIRTVVLRGGQGEMGIGSGIVYDSDPESEWQECRLKARFLTEPAPDFQLIETMVWIPGEGIWLLAEHLERLSRSAAYFDFPMERGEAERFLAGETDRFAGTAECRRLRLLLWKDGRMEVQVAPGAPPARAFASPAFSKREGLPRLGRARRRVDSASPLLYHKTTRRAVYDAELQEAKARGLFEVVFENERGDVTEGSFTNIFIRRSDAFLTPPLACGLLPGVFRAHFLTHCPLPVTEQPFSWEELVAADAVYVCNSVRGLVEVFPVE